MNKIVINIFVDAFGREIFKRYGFNKTILPFNKRIETVFGFSSACEPSIFSGRYPSEHQHFSSYFYDKKKSPFNSLSLLYKLSPGALKSFLDHGVLGTTCQNYLPTQKVTQDIFSSTTCH